MVYDAGKKLGNYRLLRLLGQGGNADVYLGEHIYLKSLAAIKVLRVRLNDDALQQFITEARTIVRLKHPHIVSVLEFGIEDDDPFLVMDYAPHGSLRVLHPVGHVLPATTVLAYVKPVAQALDYAHERKIIHRDVKPENLLLGEDEALLLSDFGIALTTQSMPSNPMLKKPQSADIRGTTTYMAPELFVSIPSFLSDQYSLGIVAYEWLCGQPPFQGSDMEVALQHVHIAPAPLQTKVPDLPAAIAQVVMKAIAKKPDERYPSILEFAEAFEQACKNAGLSVTANTKLMLPGGNAPATSLHIRAMTARMPSRFPQRLSVDGDGAASPAAPAPASGGQRNTMAPSILPGSSLKLPTQAHLPIPATKRLFDYVPETSPAQALPYEPAQDKAQQVAAQADNVHLTPPTQHHGQFARHIHQPAALHAVSLPNGDTSVPAPSASAASPLQARLQALLQPLIAQLRRMVSEGRRKVVAQEGRNAPYPVDDFNSSRTLPALRLPQQSERIATHAVPAVPLRQLPPGSQHLPTVRPPALHRDTVLSRRMVLWGLGVVGVAGVAGIVGTVSWQDMHSRAQPVPTPLPTTSTPTAQPSATPAPVNLQIINSTRPTLASWGAGQFDLFVRGSDGNLWHRHFAGGWQTWNVVQGGMVFDPSVVTWATGRFDVFARGADNTLQHCWYDGNWHPWESLGGALTSDPAVISWGPNRLDVFVRSSDNGLYHKWFDGSWHDWEPLGGVLTSSPAAATWGPNRMDVFVRGSDNALWHRAFDGSWHDWESLGGSLIADPGAISTTVNRIDIFARNSVNALVHRVYDGAWEGWDTVEGVLTSSPTVVSWGSGRIDIFGRDTRNMLQQSWYDGKWNPWIQVS